MIKITFSKETRNKLTVLMVKAVTNGSPQLVRKISALLFFAMCGDAKETAKAHGIALSTFYKWFNDFLRLGFKSLKYKKSSGRPPKLTKKQKKRLKEIVAKNPEEYKTNEGVKYFDSNCWNSIMVQELIRIEFNVFYNHYYITTLLKNLGFSYQKAKFVSDHLDEQARKLWMEKTWPQILKEAISENAKIFFEDEASFAQWGSLARTWAIIGQQPVIKTSGKRKGYKVFGCIDYFTGEFIFESIEERFKSETYISFLKKVLENTSGKIIIIHDGATWHRSAATRAFIEKNSERLTAYRLPSYSPDYNPIEFLWKKLKQRSTHNKYFPDFISLIMSVDEGLQYFQNNPNEVKCLMGKYCKKLKGKNVA